MKNKIRLIAVILLAAAIVSGCKKEDPVDDRVVVVTGAISETGSFSVNIAVTITAKAGFDVTGRGVCWSESQKPTVESGYKTDDGAGAGSFAVNINGLIPGRRYYYRAYAETSIGVRYGEQREHVTSIPANGLYVQPGGLQAAVLAAGFQSNTELKVYGDIDARDISYMSSSMAQLSKLDLSGTTIKAYQDNEANKIPNDAFSGRAGLVSFRFPANIEVIGASAFSGCTGLSGNLEIPWSVKTIGDHAFNSCLGFSGTLFVPQNVESIGNFAFSQCKGFDGTLGFPESLHTLGTYAFDGCSGFTGSLTIPATMQTIGSYAFNGCSGFTGDLTINTESEKLERNIFSGCGFRGRLIINGNVKRIEASVFEGCGGFTGGLSLPASLERIEASAFKGCGGFTGALTIPANVRIIGATAFSGCSGFDGRIEIPESVFTIGSQAFAGCDNVTGIKTFWQQAQDIVAYETGMLPVGKTIFIPSGTTAGYTSKGWDGDSHILQEESGS